MKTKIYKMTVLFEELKEKLERLDEVSLLELLNVSSRDLINAFSETIEDNMDKFLKEVE
jgi:hypothetical protein